MFFLFILFVCCNNDVHSKCNEIDFNNIKNVIYEIFGDIEIDIIEYMYNINDLETYIYVDFVYYGYAIFYNETLELVECSMYNDLNYPVDEKKYYMGPMKHYIKREDKFINILTNEYFDLSNNNINVSDDDYCLSNGKEALSGTFDYEEYGEQKGLFAPKFDDEKLILGDNEYVSNTRYINNYEYFLANPTHGSNEHGTCGSVALQILLGYHNYYSNRQIILPQYLNGNWIGDIGDDINKAENYEFPEKNINVCYYPVELNEFTTGSNDEFYKYIIGLTEPTAFDCICTRTIVEKNGLQAYLYT